MMPDPNRPTRTLRRAAVVALLAAVALLVYVGKIHSTTSTNNATVATDDGDEAPVQGWRRWIPGAARSAPPLTRWRLEGRVVDGNDRPVAGADVHLARPARAIASGSDGKFAFDGLVAGAYDVDARLDDRVGGPVRAHVGPDATPVTLRLYRGARLEIEVVSAADGKPIANADVEVRVIHMHEGGGTQRGRTGADGKVQLAGAILIGSEIWAAAPGFAPALKSIDPATAGDGRWPVRVELAPGGAISGRVVDEHGGPIAGAIVETFNAGGGGEARRMESDPRFGAAQGVLSLVRREGVVTDPLGQFRVALAPGAWRLVATHDRYQGAVSERIISDGKSARELVLVMKNGVRVRGHVVRTDGRPAPGAIVRVRWQFNARVEREARADGDGRFVFNGLPPAPLSFQAEGDGAISLPQLIDLEYPPKEDLSLSLDDNGVITGTVVDAADNPLPDVDVVYVEHSSSMLMTRVQPSVETTDGRGRFTIRGLAPGVVYSLNAKRAQDGDALFRVGSVDASAGQDVTIRIPGDGSVIGKVTRAGGGSMAGVLVEVVDGGRRPQPVGPDGRFRFDDLFAREYSLRVTAANAGFRNVAFTVHSGEVTDVGTIDLPRAKVVSGTVERSDGSPSMGAGVVVTIAGDPQPVSTNCDPNGKFSVVVPVDAQLTVTASDRRLGQTAPQSFGPSDPTTDLELKFPPAGSVEGTVTAAGKPLGFAAVVALPDGMGSKAPSIQSAQSDGNGYYRIDGLAAGGYSVQLAAGDAPAGAPVMHVQIVVGQKAFANLDLPTAPPSTSATPTTPTTPTTPGTTPPPTRTGGGTGRR